MSDDYKNKMRKGKDFVFNPMLKIFFKKISINLRLAYFCRLLLFFSQSQVYVLLKMT